MHNVNNWLLYIEGLVSCLLQLFYSMYAHCSSVSYIMMTGYSSHTGQLSADFVTWQKEAPREWQWKEMTDHL